MKAILKGCDNKKRDMFKHLYTLFYTASAYSTRKKKYIFSIIIYEH